MFDAIRASIAIPMVFTPFKHGQRTLLDGCLVNPLPISPTLNDATDLTVVVSLGGPAEARPLPQPNAPLVSGDGYAQRIILVSVQDETINPRPGGQTSKRVAIGRKPR